MYVIRARQVSRSDEVERLYHKYNGDSHKADGVVACDYQDVGRQFRRGFLTYEELVDACPEVLDADGQKALRELNEQFRGNRVILEFE